VSCGNCGGTEWIHETLLTEDDCEQAKKTLLLTKSRESIPQKRPSSLTVINPPGSGSNYTSFTSYLKAGLNHTRYNPSNLFIENVTEVFNKDLPLRKKGYKKRLAQIELSEEIAKTLINPGVLISETGVGTGKTYAYTIPALLRDLWVKAEALS